MTTKQAIRLLPALLFPLLLATGCDSATGVMVDPPEVESGPFTIESRQVAVSATTMEGTFEASGSIGDRGSVREVMYSPAPLHQRASVHGMKTLIGEKGTMTIEFYAGLSRIDPVTLRAVGGFGIVAGTGAYEALRGGGKIDIAVAANASPDEVTRVLEGVARYAR